MNIYKKSIGLLVAVLLLTGEAQAQVPASAQYADPGISDILNQGGGNIINQTTNLTFNIFNSSNGVPGTGIIPANAINVQIGFPSQYGIQNGTTSLLTTLLAGQGWDIDYIETGASGTIVVTNTQSIAEFDGLPITIPVIGFAAGTGLTTVTVDRNLPIQTNNVNTANDVVSAPFTVSQPLPVTLLLFTASKVKASSLLKWATSSESGNRGFTIERSIDGHIWDNIGFVGSKAENGHSRSRLDYQFTDTNPPDRKNFYRLRQTDLDDKWQYSEVLMLDFSKASIVKLSPNPVKHSLSIEGLQGICNIVLVNIAGQVMMKFDTEIKGTFNVDMSRLTSGVYYITLSPENGNTSTHKLIKQ